MTEVDDCARAVSDGLTGCRLLPDRTTDEIRTQVRELVRGLVIAADMGGLLLPLSSELDQMWLAILAEPLLWQQVQQLLPSGVDLVHVRSTTADLSTHMLDWIERYRHRFGPVPPEVAGYWPVHRYLETLRLS
ncbi:hypothetical protein [Actinocrispum sp. NPDC049592]|uniref:hypothetical protein n=1 Tax=Actinocrispum sp. NPDC049592 TaxID=3154835 RepID=UPI00344904DC